MFVADDVDDIFKNTPQLITVDQMNLASLTAQSTQGAIWRELPHPCCVKGASRLEERTTPDASPQYANVSLTWQTEKYCNYRADTWITTIILIAKTMTDE